ncbi:hypothetical protein NP233_g7943 [Leucocoprinus birnbaumii]|uniref:Uncharacterized protein n=1 Tax=Leucocoprinus birnbaumii TaxID=56174 RepID=A0AAD5YUA2_9AGAR|nr:hypothetical protein NP233_g7943 [Leucocoprinus birnbaumii]
MADPLATVRKVQLLFDYQTGKYICYINAQATHTENELEDYRYEFYAGFEMTGALIAFICQSGFIAPALLTASPLPGCWFSYSPSIIWQTLNEGTLFALWITRFSVTTIEAILMLIKLCEALKAERRFSDKSLLTAIGERRRCTPVLYIFHRDGALLIIAISIISAFGVVATVVPYPALTQTDWNMWLLLIYQLFGSRLILNIRRANGKLTGSIVPEHLSTLRFESCGHISGQESEP